MMGMVSLKVYRLYNELPFWLKKWTPSPVTFKWMLAFSVQYTYFVEYIAMSASERINLHPTFHVVVVKAWSKYIKWRKIPPPKKKNVTFSHIFFMQLVVACLYVKFNECSLFSLSHLKYGKNKSSRRTRHFPRTTIFAF